MNNLIKVSDLSPTLTPMEQKIVLASQAGKIKDMTTQELFDLVVDQISIAVFTVGQNPKESKELKILATSVCSDLVNKFHNLTKEEFKQALNLGARGEFKVKPDEVLFVSVASIYHWIKSYNEQVRREAIAKQRQFEEKNEKTEWTEDRIAAMERLTIEDLLSDWGKSVQENKNLVFDPYGGIYSIMVKKGILSPSDESKRSTFMFHRAKFLSAYNRSNLPQNEWKDFEIFKNGKGVPVTNIFYVRVALQTKEFFVREYIDFLLETEQDLEEILNDL